VFAPVTSFFRARVFFIASDLASEVLHCSSAVVDSYSYGLYGWRSVSSAGSTAGAASPSEVRGGLAFSPVPIAVRLPCGAPLRAVAGSGAEDNRPHLGPVRVGVGPLRHRRAMRPCRSVDAAFVWYSRVALILAGHVFAVYLAHAVALRLPRGHMRAAGSHLWILSQPSSSSRRGSRRRPPPRRSRGCALRSRGPSRS
jgi:hypothetical protein